MLTESQGRTSSSRLRSAPSILRIPTPVITIGAPLGLLVLAAALRIYGYDFDGGLLLHPDELAIDSAVSNLGCCLGPPSATAATWPSPFTHALDPATAPYNPHFFNYGSLPLYLLAAASRMAAFLGATIPGLGAWRNASDLAHVNWIGRWLSAAFDVGTLAILYRMTLRLFDRSTALLALTFGVFTVLEIQLSHFYAVDTVLTFFVMAALLSTIHALEANQFRWYVAAGSCLGAALATKSSAFPLVLPLAAAPFLFTFASMGDPFEGGAAGMIARFRSPRLLRVLNRGLLGLAGAILLAAVVFVLTEPYGIIDHSQLLMDVQTQNGIIVTHSIPVPYTIQFVGTAPYLYYLKNMVLWYMGPALGLAALLGTLWVVFRALPSRRDPRLLLLLLWVIPYSFVVGRFWAKFGRYTLPILPILSLFAAAFLIGLIRRSRGRWRILTVSATATVTAATVLWALAFMHIYTVTNPQIAASDWMYTHLRPGTPFATEGAWDRSLPFCTYPRLGECPPGYSGYALDLYSPDDSSKVHRIVHALTRDRYIVMATQRFVDSIPKEPQEYPITTRYYHLLFNNRLNFRLVQRFAVHPQLGPWVIDDFPADENFTVFDHPDVRIFKRTSPISPAAARRLLLHTSTAGLSLPEFDSPPPRSPTTVSPNSVLPPIDANQRSQDHRLLLTPSQWRADQSSQTYDQMFPPNGFGMRHPTLVWLFLIELIGLSVFPIAFFACRGLRDRGWIVGKTLGLVTLGWLVWASVSLGLFTFTPSTVWIAISALLLVGLVTGWFQRRALTAFMSQRWKEVAVAELVFLAGFGLFVLLRMWYPDLGHQFGPPSPTNPGYGRMGEKQLELAFLNATVRSRSFPPLDPFFAGGYINYYYFGYLLVGVLCKATFIAPSTGFNLAIPMFFGLLAAGCYSIGRALTGSIRFGLVTTLFVSCLGNLNGLTQFVRDLQSVAALHSSFPFFGGVFDCVDGLVEATVLHKPMPPFDFWESTRLVPPVGTDFAEFPYFTYLFGDLHAHLMAYPMDLAVLAMAVSLLMSVRRMSKWTVVAALAISAMLLGGIEATNPFDLPAYGLMLGFGIAAGVFTRLRSSKPFHRRIPRVVIALGAGGIGLAVTVVAAVILFPPFTQGYHPVFPTGLASVSSAATSVRLALQAQQPPLPASQLPGAVHDQIVTPIHIYLETFGLFLFLIASWMVLRITGTRRPLHPGWMGLVAGTAAGCIILVLLNLWLLAALLFLGFMAVLASLRRPAPPARLLWLGCLILLPLMLTAFTETWYIRDYLSGGLAFRMNTVAKLYNQVWVLFAVAAAVSLSYLDRLRRLRGLVRTRTPPPLSHSPHSRIGVPSPTALFTLLQPNRSVAFATYTSHGSAGETPELSPTRPGIASAASHRSSRFVAFAWVAVVGVLIFGSLIYDYSGTIARETYRQTWIPEDSVPLTLDGMAFMKVAYPDDYAAISWMNAHIEGAPVIVEADQAYYNWRSRVVQFTGLPTLYGGIYEGAQRYGDQVAPRQGVLEEIYSAGPATVNAATLSAFGATKCRPNSPSRARCLTAWLLRAYHVSYVFVGSMERQLWPGSPGKMSRMSLLHRTFHRGGTSIYHVKGSAT